MAEIWKGAPVVEALNRQTKARAEALRAAGVEPVLAIVRVGARPDGLSYERSSIRRCSTVGVTARTVVLEENCTQEELLSVLDRLGRDDGVHGILVLQPLPAHLDREIVRRALPPEKDVDGITDASLAGVFTGSHEGFPPCTAQGAIAMLEHAGVSCAGKRAVVVGRSLVAGRPAAMLLLEKNATVTICHRQTADLPALCRQADILVVCAGQKECIGREHLRPGQIVIDVGIHWDEKEGRICGDVRLQEALESAAAVTPVPGGVGTVATAVLALHTVEAAERSRRL